MVRQFWRNCYGSRGALLHEFPLFDPELTPMVLDYGFVWSEAWQRWTDAVLLPEWPESVELTFRRNRPPGVRFINASQNGERGCDVSKEPTQ